MIIISVFHLFVPSTLQINKIKIISGEVENLNVMLLEAKTSYTYFIFKKYWLI